MTPSISVHPTTSTLYTKTKCQQSSISSSSPHKHSDPQKHFILEADDMKKDQQQIERLNHNFTSVVDPYPFTKSESSQEE